jgi:hypothetical protein
MRLIAAVWLAALLAVHTIRIGTASGHGAPVVRMARYVSQQGAQAAAAPLWSEVGSWQHL